MSDSRHLLVVDAQIRGDEPRLEKLRVEGWVVTVVASLADARRHLTDFHSAIVLAAENLPDGCGRELRTAAHWAGPLIIWAENEIDPTSAAHPIETGDARWVKSRISPDAFPLLLTQARHHWQVLADHRAVELALREERSRLTAIVNASRLGTWEWNVETGEVIVNEGWAAMLGYALAELAPIHIETWRRLAHPEDLERSDAALKLYFEGKIPFYECDGRMRHKDGRWIWVNDRGMIAHRNPDGSPLVVCGTHTEITGRREAEAGVRQSERRFHTMLQSVQSVAVQGYAPDGTTLYWNKASELLYGYTAEEALGRNLLDLIIPAEMCEPVRAAVAAMAATGEPVPADELSLQRKDGSRISVFSSHAVVTLPGRAPELFCIDVDLTELRRAQARLQLQSTALNVAANGIVITDRNGRIEWANDAFARSSGYSVEELIAGQATPRVIRSGQHDRAFYESMWQTILSGHVWHGEVINRRKNGSLYTEEMTITPIRDDHGEVTRFIAVKQDVTQRKVLEERFRQAQKMHAIGQLAGGVAHDFNNILAAALMYLGLIKDAPALDPTLRKALEELVHEVHRGAALTRQLLAFSRQQAIVKQRLDLGEVVSGMLKMLRRLLGETIHITFQAAPGLPAVEADPAMMDQIVMNLCINARDAMPEGGHLTLKLDEITVTPEMAARSVGPSPGHFVRLRVIDTGRGMGPEVLARLFEPYFTTKDVGKGTGLGLATVYGIVQQHNGSIHVESQLGEGATFHVHLPASAKHAAAPARTPKGLAPRGRGETILLIEDERSLRVSVAIILQQHGYKVLDAADGPAAMRLWEQHSHSVDLLLTDLVLPNRMSGLELIDRFTAERPQLKVIASTGYTREEAALSERIEAGLRVLRKPYDHHQLLEQLRSTLGHP